MQVSRLNILEAKLRSAPVEAGVNLTVLAALTDGMTGAELSEVCRRACQLALRCETLPMVRLYVGLCDSLRMRGIFVHMCIPEPRPINFVTALATISNSWQPAIGFRGKWRGLVHASRRELCHNDVAGVLLSLCPSFIGMQFTYVCVQAPVISLRPRRSYVEAEDAPGEWAPPVAVVKASHFEDALASCRSVTSPSAQPTVAQPLLDSTFAHDSSPAPGEDVDMCGAAHDVSPALEVAPSVTASDVSQHVQLQPQQQEWVHEAAATATAAVMQQLQAKDDEQARYIAALEEALLRAGAVLPARPVQECAL